MSNNQSSSVRNSLLRIKAFVIVTFLAFCMVSTGGLISEVDASSDQDLNRFSPATAAQVGGSIDLALNMWGRDP